MLGVDWLTLPANTYIQFLFTRKRGTACWSVPSLGVEVISSAQCVHRAVFVFTHVGVFEGYRYVNCEDGTSLTEEVVVEIVSKDKFMRKFAIGSPY